MNLRNITDQHIIELLKIFGYEKNYFCETSHSSLILNDGKPKIYKKVIDKNGAIIVYNIYQEHLLIIRDGSYDIKKTFTSKYHLSAINFLLSKGYELKTI
ncbi:MAG: hypothetical protein ACOC3V_00780 [bacterium]